MSHILICNVPFHGHINPTLAIVRELVAGGEAVRYYATDPFRPAIEAAGAEFRRYESLLAGGTTRGPRRPPPATVLEGMLRECFQAYDQVFDAVQADPPDYLIYDAMCLWAPLLARQLDIPAVAFHTSFVSPHTSVSISPGAQRTDIQLCIKNLQAEYGRPMPDPRLLWDHVEPLNLVFFPHFFQPEVDDERFLFVGPSIRPHEQPGDFPLDRLQRDSTLYISLGTVFTNKVDFYQMCFKAFGDKPWQVVMAYGNRLDRGALGPVPPNFLAAPHVPQLAVLRQSAVFLTHGGMNSVVEALYYGVPMVICPQTREQILTARRIVALGLGVMLISAIVNDATLSDAVEQIMGEPAFHARARQIQAELQAAGGHQQVVRALAQVRRVQVAV